MLFSFLPRSLFTFYMCSFSVTETKRQRDREKDRQTDRQSQTDRPTDRPTDRQTDRDRYRKTNRNRTVNFLLLLFKTFFVSFSFCFLINTVYIYIYIYREREREREREILHLMRFLFVFRPATSAHVVRLYSLLYSSLPFATEHESVKKECLQTFNFQPLFYRNAN